MKGYIKGGDVTLGVVLPPEVLAQIDEKCSEWRLSRSYLAAQAIIAGLPRLRSMIAQGDES